MKVWVSKLRTQAAGIVGGNYLPCGPLYADAPDDIAALSRDLDALALTIAEREAARQTLALEVHHRVKNNLQIVSSLLNMQASRLENPAAREAMAQTRARIGGLALIHRIVYEQVDDGNSAALDIARLISELCSQFSIWNRDRPEIAFSSMADPFTVPIDSALPLVLFAVEAITNACAYAFPDERSGCVDLHFSLALSGKAVFSVRDDGVGFDSTRAGYFMGRQLMNGFARQLGGKLAIESSAASGTEVRLEYPVTA